jgi:hypothetical protein
VHFVVTSFDLPELDESAMNKAYADVTTPHQRAHVAREENEYPIPGSVPIMLLVIDDT